MKIKNPFGSFLDTNFFNSMVTGVVFLVFILIVVVLITTTVNLILPSPPPTPTDFDPLFIEYMGLPYIFWVLLGVGLALGLTIHGFRIITVETRK